MWPNPQVPGKLHFLCSDTKANVGHGQWAISQLVLRKNPSQLTLTCVKSTIDTLEKGVKYVQS